MEKKIHSCPNCKKEVKIRRTFCNDTCKTAHYKKKYITERNKRSTVGCLYCGIGKCKFCCPNHQHEYNIIAEEITLEKLKPKIKMNEDQERKYNKIRDILTMGQIFF